MSGLDAALAGGRFAQYAGVSLAAGGALFQVYGVRAPWAAALARIGCGLGIAGAAIWLMAETGLIGVAADAFHPAQVWSVASGTGFGRAALARAGLLAAAFVALLRTPAPWRMVASLGLAAAAALAWSGHGAMGTGLAGAAHLAADAVHAIAAATWIGALACLALLAPDGRNRAAAVEGLAAFSRVGVWVVTAVVVTGLVNATFLLGLSTLPQITESLYGRLLGAKLALFAAILLLAAVNRWRLTRAIAAPVLVEALLAATVLGVVAAMGAVPPPMQMAG